MPRSNSDKRSKNRRTRLRKAYCLQDALLLTSTSLIVMAYLPINNWIKLACCVAWMTWLGYGIFAPYVKRRKRKKLQELAKKTENDR